MAIVNGLCTLADVKSLLGISDTSSDSRLELFINQVSSQIISYLGRNIIRASYSETYPCPNRQLLVLRNFPIISVASITFDGNPLTAGSDYIVSPEYSTWGAVYREQGWIGYPINREYLTTDPVAGKRVIVVAYTAGYYLPADPAYVAGAADSLPLDLQYAACLITAGVYTQAAKRNFDGLTSMSEGGLSYSWMGRSMIKANNQSGFAETPGGILNKYRRVAVEA